MNEKQQQARAGKIQERIRQIRNAIWPDIDDKLIWNRKRGKGFTTIPRTMPLILRLQDTLSKGKPLSSTYLSLWSRVFDEAVVEIANPRDCAFESGFSGERQQSTWAARMRSLRSEGFILTAEAQYGEFSYVLLLDPYAVVSSLNAKGKIPKDLYIAFIRRSHEIGAPVIVKA